MGKRRKLKALVRRELSLEEQLAELDANEVPGSSVRGALDYLIPPSAERQEWARKRLALTDAIRQRDAKSLADPGPDAGGNFAPSPYAARGHLVEDAPKALRKTAESKFPKRIATQRMVDRYFRSGHIDARQWKAADRLWQLWCNAGLEANVVARYSGDRGKGNNYTAPFEGKANAAMEYLTAMSAVPYRCRGCIIHVVVLDWPASDWARGRGYRGRDSESKGMARLRPGLSALADYLGY